MIVFDERTHSYTSKEDDGTTNKYTSVTSVIGLFKQPFDAKSVAAKVSKNKKSKWYGKTPEEIERLWKAEADRSCDLGNFYHGEREADLLAHETLTRHGAEVPVFAPQKLVGPEGVVYKVAPDQKLTPGVYPEHMVYLKSVGISGQSDLVEVVGNKVHITDYKTNKEIKTESFKNWEGISQKMSYPVSHLDDCNYYHYALQLSLYMYIILRHNPRLEPGDLTIHHVSFEEDEPDENGFPKTKVDKDGRYIVKHINVYKLPYLKSEVINILKHFDENKEKLLKQKYGKAV